MKSEAHNFQNRQAYICLAVGKTNIAILPKGDEQVSIWS